MRKTKAYYNEFNPETAAMLSQLIADGHCAPGDVDTRSITEVTPDDLKGYTQCHFFAGIGGWSIALRLAGWPDERPVWTGSCPCQPFSSAGKQKGKADERHLWPVWHGLISQLHPTTIFGEQVASAVAHGWLDDVYQGLEAEGYAVGAAVLPACSVGAPHKRDRLWFVGYTEHYGWDAATQSGSDGTAVQYHPQGQDGTSKPAGAGSASYVANSKQQGLEGQRGLEQGNGEKGREAPQRHPWASGVWIDCPDGRQRLVEPSIRLLADGFQHRKPILHAFGNAIVPQVAAQFIKASM